MSFPSQSSGCASELTGRLLPAETYRVEGPSITRTVTTGTGDAYVTDVAASPGTCESDPYAAFWKGWLCSASPPSPVTAPRATVTTADLFSGCGGLSVGIREACRALGLDDLCALAVDTNENALRVFEQNFAPKQTHAGSITDFVDGELGTRATANEKRLRSELEGLTIAVGGPPCQGHSDLNNHTRRRDPKNSLYLRMARFAEVVQPEHVVIENVPGVRHDRGRVVDRATDALRRIGYTVTDGILIADELGWAQRRRRHVLIASRSGCVSVERLALGFARQPLPVEWAIGQVEPTGRSTGTFDTPSRHSNVNRERIRYLFDRDIYDLPNEMRPDCHRLKPHSYTAVYGRMRPGRPAPTITAGFGSTGQGRFVHPTEMRTLTPHEAARLQGFPDWFDFSPIDGRRALQEMIGNAVPSRLAYVIGIGLLG